MSNRLEANGLAKKKPCPEDGRAFAQFCAKMAIVSQELLDGKRESKTGEIDRPFLEAKVKNARFYFERILPRTQAHKGAMLSGMGNMMEITEEQLLIQG